MGQLNRFLFTFIFLTLTSGCTPPKEHPASLRRTRLSPLYDEAACLIPKTRGAPADLALAGLEKPETSRFFNKRYNASYLQAVLSTSAVGTGQFVSHLLKGRVYRVQHDYVAGKKVCPTFTELPKAPDDLLGIWESQTARIPSGRASLSGLYFAYCADDCDDREVKRPTILIDDIRDRWTLVHEMMHYNFDRERKRDPNLIGDNELLRRATLTKAKLYQSYLSYQSRQDQASLSELAESSSWLIRTFAYETLVRGLFEEIATEGLLLDKYLSGELVNVALPAAENALRYLDYAAREGARQFDEIVYQHPPMSFSLKALARYIRIEATSRGWSDIAALATDDQLFIQALLNEAGGFSDEAQRNLPARQILSGAAHSSINGQTQNLETHIHHLPGMRIFDLWKRK